MCSTPRISLAMQIEVDRRRPLADVLGMVADPLSHCIPRMRPHLAASRRHRVAGAQIVSIAFLDLVAAWRRS